MGRRSRFVGASFIAFALAVTVAACGDDSQPAASSSAGNSGGAVSATSPTTVRLGYFPNITHAPAIVGVEKGLFQQELGQHTLKTSTFNAGPEAVDAIFADALDATFIGPNPAINAFQKSNGEAIRIVSGSTSAPSPR